MAKKTPIDIDTDDPEVIVFGLQEKLVSADRDCVQHLLAACRSLEKRIVRLEGTARKRQKNGFTRIVDEGKAQAALILRTYALELIKKQIDHFKKKRGTEASKKSGDVWRAQLEYAKARGWPDQKVQALRDAMSTNGAAPGQIAVTKHRQKRRR